MTWEEHSFLLTSARPLGMKAMQLYWESGCWRRGKEEEGEETIYLAGGPAKQGQETPIPA